MALSFRSPLFRVSLVRRTMANRFGLTILVLVLLADVGVVGAVVYSGLDDRGIKQNASDSSGWRDEAKNQGRLNQPAGTFVDIGETIITNTSLVMNSRPTDFGIERSSVTAGSEFIVNTYTINAQSSSSITTLEDGGFVITWRSVEQDGSGNGIYGQRYNANGTVNGGEFQINTTNSGSQRYPSVSSLYDGGFVVIWAGNGGSDSDGIYGQRYNADGTVNGGEFQINTYVSGFQTQPSITSLLDGGFIVVWQNSGQNLISGQRYNADGTTNGGEFQVNTSSGSVRFPSVAVFYDGGLVVTWHNVSQNIIYGQKYNADGTASGGEFQISTFEGLVGVPSVISLSNNGFVVAWYSDIQDGNGRGIYGQEYNADGTANGGEFQINDTTDGDQSDVSLSALPYGGFVVSWHSFGQDGSSFAIVAKIYEATVPAGGLRIEGTPGDDILIGTAGEDVVIGYDGNDEMYGNDSRDVLYGGGGDDTIYGGDGDDYMNSGSDNDFLDGGAGNDTLVGSAGNNTFNGGDGDDLLTVGWFLNFDNLMNGDAGNDRLHGSDGADTLNGGTGNDFLHGWFGNDVIFGGAGDDTLQGDIFLVGGDYSGWGYVVGSDTFVFELESGASDMIIDFNLIDVPDIIDLTDASFAALSIFSDLNITQNVDDAVIDLGSGHTITLENYDGSTLTAADFSGIEADVAASIDDSAIPAHDSYALLPSVPNPFNPQTSIGFYLPESDVVSLNVYSVSGRHVRTLINDSAYIAGQHAVIWNGKNDKGLSVASGVYFYRLVTDSFQAINKMNLLK